MASIGTMVGTKFLANPADRNEGRESRSTFAPRSRRASSSICSSDCGGGSGRESSLLTPSGMLENKSDIDDNPISESISDSLPRLGIWSTIGSPVNLLHVRRNSIVSLEAAPSITQYYYLSGDTKVREGRIIVCG